MSGSHCKGWYRIPSPTFVFCTTQMQEFRSQRATQGDEDGYQTTRSSEIEQVFLKTVVLTPF